MPRCYMVKKGAPRSGSGAEPLAASSPAPAPISPTEGNVAPPTYRPPDVHRAYTVSEPVDEVTEYEELRSVPISERSAAETEAAHELLSLAAGVPPLLPPMPPLQHASVLTVLPTEPIVPVYTYNLQPATIYIVSGEQPEPIYHALQTIPLQQSVNGFVVGPTPAMRYRRPTYSWNGNLQPVYQRAHTSVRTPLPVRMVEYATVGNHQHMSYIAYPESLPPLPPLQYHPLQNSELMENVPAPDAEYSGLTTITIEEQITDSEPDQIPEQVLNGGRAPQQYEVEAQTSPQNIDIDVDSDEDTLFIETSKDKQGKYDCKECGKCYATSSNLSRHKQTHRDSKAAKRCKECGKAYVSMPALAMHVLTHRMGHVCGVCGKQFSRPWLLQGHVRSHTGEKPYNCVACGKAFADRSNLRAHLQTHISDKKYECARCKKSFALKSYLTKHQEAVCTLEDEDGAAA